MIFFKDISFEKSGPDTSKTYLIDSRQNQFGHTTDQPYLDVHFWQQDGSSSSLDSAKQSMGEASQWLQEVSDEYPFVFGVTYEELAKIAVRSFGFETTLDQDEIVVSKFCLDSIRIAHALYKSFNTQKTQPLEIVCVAARTDHLAKVWSRYYKK